MSFHPISVSITPTEPNASDPERGEAHGEADGDDFLGSGVNWD